MERLADKAYFSFFYLIPKNRQYIRTLNNDICYQHANRYYQRKINRKTQQKYRALNSIVAKQKCPSTS
jgi:hypothetical protein